MSNCAKSKENTFLILNIFSQYDVFILSLSLRFDHGRKPYGKNWNPSCMKRIKSKKKQNLKIEFNFCGVSLVKYENIKASYISGLLVKIKISIFSSIWLVEHALIYMPI